jgi:hypothetical protein
LYRALIPSLVACWFLAGVGGDRTPSDGGLYWVGAAFWLLFGLTLLGTVVFTIAVLIRRFSRKGAPVVSR